VSRLGMKPRDLLAVVRRTRQAGYAVRVRQYRGETPLADTLNAIACPVFRVETAVGALAMLWPKGFLSPARFAEIHLARLKEATAAISADIGAVGSCGQ